MRSLLIHELRREVNDSGANGIAITDTCGAPSTAPAQTHSRARDYYYCEDPAPGECDDATVMHDDCHTR